MTAHTQYVYDDANRLTDVITHNPSTDANVHKSTFTIDGFSRVAMTTEYNWNGTSWVQASQKHYVYDGMDPYVELGDDTDDIDKVFLRGGGGEILDEPIESDVLVQQDRYFYHDGSGNVSDVVNVKNGTTVATGHYDYDAYGNLLNETGSDADSNYYRYSGKEYIPSVGMYNYGYRFYSPGLGRWINRDPIAEGGGLNLYGAFGNSPGNFNDAYGHALGDWIDHRVFHDSVANFGTAYGNYDSGCESGWRVAQLGLIAGGKTVALGFSAGYLAAAGGTAAIGAAGIGSAAASIGVAAESSGVPARLARVVEAEYAGTATLGAPGAAEAFVTSSEDIAGISSSQGLAQRLTLLGSHGELLSDAKVVIEFDNPLYGLASPVFRTNPGFIQGGFTQGGAQEFVVPNFTINSLQNVTTRFVR